MANLWQYAAGCFESSIGLVKFGTRYYNPALGRWTQQDPVAGSLGNPDTLNRYLYAKDDPERVVDPSVSSLYHVLLRERSQRDRVV